MSWINTSDRYTYFIESMHDGVWYQVGSLYRTLENVERDFDCHIPNGCRLQIIRQCNNSRERVVCKQYTPDQFIYWTEQLQPEGWYQANSCIGSYDSAIYFYRNIERDSRKPVQLVRYCPHTCERVIIACRNYERFETEIDWKREGF